MSLSTIYAVINSATVCLQNEDSLFQVLGFYFEIMGQFIIIDELIWKELKPKAKVESVNVYV